jgi:hypothetical protein
MKKEFVPYELASKMKQLGFDEPCLASYYHAGRRLDICEYINHGEYTVLAPTYSQAFRWFREKYNVHIRIEKYDETKWWANWGSWTSEVYDSYEEAELACLEKLIEIVENK